jgi:hypothetical protein
VAGRAGGRGLRVQPLKLRKAQERRMPTFRAFEDFTLLSSFSSERETYVCKREVEIL